MTEKQHEEDNSINIIKIGSKGITRVNMTEKLIIWLILGCIILPVPEPHNGRHIMSLSQPLQNGF